MSSPLLGPLEQTVMDALWKRNPQTVRELVGALTTEKRLAYTTIQTIVTRLHTKGLLTRSIDNGLHRYQPAFSRREFLRSAWRSTLNQFFDRFGNEAITAFSEEFGNLSPSERQKLRAMLEDNEA